MTVRVSCIAVSVRVVLACPYLVFSVLIFFTFLRLMKINHTQKKINRKTPTCPLAFLHQAHFVHPMSLHHLHHALRLKGLAPLRSRREGLAEEHKVWHVHVEVPHEVPNVFPVLPHRIGAKTVNKYETWLAWLVHFGYPAMHGGSFAEVGGHRPEPRGGEQMTVQPVPRSGEADAF